MKFKGREIDSIALWEQWVEFPNGIKRGDTFAPKVQCPNPEHDTLKRHFQVNLREASVHCFAHCGISGSYQHAICVVEGIYEKHKVDLSIVQQAWGVDPRERTAEHKEHLRRRHRAFRQAERIILRSASARHNDAVSARRRASSSKDRSGGRAAATISSVDLSYESYLPSVALEYLEARGISDGSIATWELGWLPEDKRVVIPAHDENGRLKFLIKRAVLDSQQPKYLYTEGFPKTSLLWGACNIDHGMLKSHGLGLVEGSIDAIILHQYGLRIFTAILGTGISDRQRRIIDKLRPKRITLFFDKDTAGIHNIEIAVKVLRKYPIFIGRFPRGKYDPAELTKEEAQIVFEKAISLRQFKERLRAKGITFNPNVKRDRGAIEVG